MSEQHISKNERRRLKQKQRQEERQKELMETERKGKIKKFGAIAIALIFFGSIFSFVAFFVPNTPTGNSVLNTAGLNFPLGNIHWHAIPTIEICGEQKPIPTPIGNTHLGSPLLHTHEDAKIHIEGTVSNPSQITLGGFMSNIGLKFNEKQLLDKKNGDACANGQQGKVTLIVNGTENDQFENYVVKDGDLIKMVFE